MNANTSGHQTPSDYFTTAYRCYEKQNPGHKLDHYLEMIEERLDSRTVDLLDLGCGRGAFLERARRRHPDWNLYGIDSLTEATEETKRRVPRSEILKSTVSDMPYPPNSFDVITAWDVLEHLPNLTQARIAISSALRSGGLFIFVVPVYDGLTGPLIHLLDRDVTHLHKESRSWWVNWADRGFRSIQWHGILRYLLPGGFYVHLPTHRLRQHAPAILVTGINP